MNKKIKQIIMLNGTYCKECHEVILKGKLGMIINYIVHKCKGIKL
jgi:hypothetical protein